MDGADVESELREELEPRAGVHASDITAEELADTDEEPLELCGVEQEQDGPRAGAGAYSGYRDATCAEEDDLGGRWGSTSRARSY